MKLNPNYYQAGESHLCMFCDTALGKLVDGKLYALGNKVHALMSKQHEGLYVINLCMDCGSTVDFTSQANLDAIHANVVESKELQLQARGVSQLTINAQKATWNTDKPTNAWFALEKQGSDRPRLIEQYKRYLEKLNGS